jgi:hypothetical protein
VIDGNKAELQIDYAPDTLTFSASLVGSKEVEIMRASLQQDEATADLYGAIGLAFVTALNAEPVEQRQKLGDLLAAGLLRHVVRLRELGTIKTMLLMLVGEDGKAVWSAHRGVRFDDRVTRPTLH